MRRGFHGEIFRIEAGDLAAVNLGADYCAEHEFGIDQMRRSFGLDSGKSSQMQRVQRLPLAGERYKSEGLFRDGTLVGSGGSRYVRDYKDLTPTDARPVAGSTAEEVAGAWDEGDFLVAFRNEQDAIDLYDAFQRLDVALLFRNVDGNPFAPSGLVLGIVSRMPKDAITNG